mgnify:CR=1 FL=1
MPEIAEQPRVRTRNEVIAALRRRIDDARRHHATAMFLYGSAARDELTDNSDVDLFIDYDPDGPMSFVDLFDLRDILADDLQRTVDLTSRNGLHPKLRARIERSSLRIF